MSEAQEYDFTVKVRCRMIVTVCDDEGFWLTNQEIKRAAKDKLLSTLKIEGEQVDRIIVIQADPL